MFSSILSSIFTFTLLILYECLLWIAALLSIPQLLYGLIIEKKYRHSLLKRFGFGFPTIMKGERKLIWIHAVSVGEGKAVALLAKRLKSEWDNPILVVSSITETGHAEVKRSIPDADYHVFLPFDFYGITTPIVRKVKPDLVIVTETDFWYNFLRGAKCCSQPLRVDGGADEKRSALLAVVNGKISERSMRRFGRFAVFAKPLFELLDLFCLQSALYADRFHALGVPKEKIVVTGNLKFDSHPKCLSTTELADLRLQLGIGQTDKVVVIGSSHDPEEKWLLTALEIVWKQKPELKVVIVPRHPEKFDLVANWLKTCPVTSQRFSQGNLEASTRIILLDAMGMLGRCYQIADVAIVAGSYVSTVGGHNILEPLWHKVPTVFGPYMYGQPDLVEAVATYHAGLQLPIEKLAESIITLLERGPKAVALQQGCSELIQAMQGSTDRTMLALDIALRKHFQAA